MEATKIYCDVSFDEKDIAKGKGAKWDGKIKCWYFMDCINETDEYFHGYKIKKMQECLICYENKFMEKIHDEHYCCKDCLSKIEKCPLCRIKKEKKQYKNNTNSNEKVFVYVPFEHKETAKSEGLKWCGENKKWYVNLNNPKCQELTERWNGKCFFYNFYGNHRRYKSINDIPKIEEYDPAKHGDPITYSVNVLGHE